VVTERRGRAAQLCSVSPPEELQTAALRVRWALYGREPRQVKHLATYCRAVTVRPRGVREVRAASKSTISGATLFPVYTLWSF
jgi:hypothetical protein